MSVKVSASEKCLLHSKNITCWQYSAVVGEHRGSLYPALSSWSTSKGEVHPKDFRKDFKWCLARTIPSNSEGKKRQLGHVSCCPICSHLWRCIEGILRVDRPWDGSDGTLPIILRFHSFWRIWSVPYLMGARKTLRIVFSLCNWGVEEEYPFASLPRDLSNSTF